MSGILVTQSKLTGNANLIAVIPAANIYSGDVPSGVCPAIGMKDISGVERLTVAMSETSRFKTERIQVTVYARTVALRKQYMQLVRLAMPHSRGIIATVNCDSILPGGDGPDFHDDILGIYEQSQDFMVRFNT